jgi:hypothetical protein
LSLVDVADDNCAAARRFGVRQPINAGSADFPQAAKRKMG